MFDKPVEIGDIEVAPNLFTYTGIDGTQDIEYITSLLVKHHGEAYTDVLDKYEIPYTQFVIGHERNDLKAFVKHFSRDMIFVGFNNIGYDSLIIKYILLIASNKLRIPPIAKGLKTIATTPEGITSDIEYIVFKGEKLKSVNDLLYTIYMMSQAIVTIPFSEKSKSKLLKKFKKIDAPYIDVDLFAIMEGQGDEGEGTNERKSLKMLAIMYKWLRVEDLPYKYYEPVNPGLLPDILDYNLNDVLITLLSYVKRRKDLALRVNMMEKYGYGYEILSYNKSTLASLFIENDYAALIDEPVHRFKYLRTIRNSIRLQDCILDAISFQNTIKIDVDEMVKLNGAKKKTPQILFEQVDLTYFLDYLKAITVYSTSCIDYVLHFKGISFNFKSGGLHSVDTPNIFRSVQGKVYYKDYDFDSYYPQLRKFGKVFPAHLNFEAFDTLADRYVADRIVYKKSIKTFPVGSKERTDAETGSNSLKIVVNSGLFGKFGSEHSFMCDLKALLTITVNGQLVLLMLAERYIDAGIKVVNANTDGLICEVKHEQLDTYYRIGEEFSKFIEIGYEYTNYAIYACKNVNNYIAVKEGAEELPYDEALDKELIKQKGEFIDIIDPAKGYKHPIVPLAVNRYFIDGTDVAKTIKEHCAKDPMNIMDFCFAEKINAKTFNMELRKPNGEIQYLQKTNRAYVAKKVSKNGLYGQLYKSYINPTAKTSAKGKVTVNKGSYFKDKSMCTVFNDWFPVEDVDSYNVDYEYYIRLARETVVTLEQRISSASAARTKKKIKEAIGNRAQTTLNFDM